MRINYQIVTPRRTLALLFIISIFFLGPRPAEGVSMTSTNYAIQADAISAGGLTTATSTNYQIGSTLGEFFAFTATSTNYASRGGFWQIAAGEVALSLDATSVSFGNLVVDNVRSASQIATVTSSFSNGYVLTIVEDGDLRSGANTINDVQDGTVSVGVEEYGLRTSGTDGQYNATDTGITGVAKTIATRAAPANGVSTTVTYKATIDANTAAGNYSHTVTLTLTSSF
ncbi:MAG TPA: hypothetical protein DDW36_02435 [Candidatus Magasanikbacteria bacterium]|nr:hypothetical protein [Candidatus Magasanikbacteria bacterium]